MKKIAIVGRANVGKSTLFNRLIEKNKALVSSIAGTTRDRNIAVADWGQHQFQIIDTGGLDIDKTIEVEIAAGIVQQARQGIAAADLILFLIDIKAGVLPTDKRLAHELVKAGLKDKIMLVANKADNIKLRQYHKDIFSLGLGEPQFISAANGSGVGDLLDLIAERLPKIESDIPECRPLDSQTPIKIAIVGKPNVGKSSLLNSILGEERVIVTDIPQTTREAHDTQFDYNGQRFVIIDTAGIRKHARIKPGSLEKKSVDKSLAAIQEAEVVLLVTEAQKKIDIQDKKISQKILEAGKSVIIVANKWDLIPAKDTATVNEYRKYYELSFPYLWWAPLIFISAKEHQRTKKILDLVREIKKSRAIRIADSQLDKFLKSKIKRHRPSRGKGLKNPYIYEIKQSGINPPRFAISVNDPAILHFSYLRFLQNNLREQFKIMGTPIRFELIKWKEQNTSHYTPRRTKPRRTRKY